MQTSRLVQHTQVKARARREIGKDVRVGRAALSRQHHRDRGGRISGVAAGQGNDSLQRHGRHDGQRLGVQRDQRAARARRHRYVRLRPAHQRRRRRQYRRSVRRLGDFPRALLGDHQDAAAAGRRDHRRTLDSGKGARRRRRDREDLRRAPGGHAARAVAQGKRARGRRGRSSESRSWRSPASIAFCKNCICTGAPQGVHIASRRKTARRQ